MLHTLLLAATLAQGYARPDLLVETDWLAAHTTDPAVRIVDMRVRGYDAGHVPGAVRLENDAIRVATRPPAFLPTPAEFEQVMARLGIANNTRVVVYDDRGGIYAARLWLALNAFGHTNVALLNGGWTKWIAEGRPTTRDAPTLAAATFRARPDMRWIATAQDVLSSIGKPDTRIVDARTTMERAGTELRGIKRGGYIKSSVHVYWEDALDPVTKAFKPAAEIEKPYRANGITPAQEVITYCQVGMRASHNLFALALIGHTKLRVYYGSWEEWGNRDDLPVEKRQP